MARRNRFQEGLEIPAMAWALGLPVGARMLEVGCGPGIALPALSRLCRPACLAGLDIDPALIEEAEGNCRERGTEVELICADVREMPFEDQAFDVVIDFGTLFHISEPERALREIRRVLAPGGRLVHETKLSQLLSHPVRSFSRRIPWREVRGELAPGRPAVLWAQRVRTRV